MEWGLIRFCHSQMIYDHLFIRIQIPIKSVLEIGSQHTPTYSMQGGKANIMGNTMSYHHDRAFFAWRKTRTFATRLETYRDKRIW